VRLLTLKSNAPPKGMFTRDAQKNSELYFFVQIGVQLKYSPHKISAVLLAATAAITSIHIEESSYST
jgi:hypothetical protein